ncbi:sugar phosphate isomerase/epimerase family protein [Candidatus Poribacteria bacterium]
MGFKLGYSSLRWKEPVLEDALKQIKDAGWDGWEVRQPLDWLGPAKRLRSLSDDAGLGIACLTARGISLDKNPKMMEENRRRMDYTAELEADSFMFMGAGKPKDREVTREDIAALAELADEFADYASQYDLDVCYHIHVGTTVDNKEDWVLLMDMMKQCELCIDISHSDIWGYEPEDSIKDYKDRLVYIHIQDYTDPPPMTELGEGKVDIPRAMKALEDIGYDRWVVTCPGSTDRSESEKIQINRAYLKSIGY